MKEIERLQMDIDRKKQELTRLIETQNALKMSGLVYQIAIALHNKLCKQNHADRCSWFYEMNSGERHQWEAATHSEYLEKAQNIVDKNKQVSEENILNIIEAIE